MAPLRQIIARWTQPLRVTARAVVFFLKVFPMLPSRPVDWVTKSPVVEKVKYPSSRGPVEGDLYRPATAGPHPGVVVCLGVVPFDVEHPQVPVLGKALARAGFAALLYWSPAMRDFRLDPVDIEDIARAYDWLVGRTDVDPARSGLIGTCVGGAFALMAAASPRIRERIALIFAYAPFSSMWTFARDIASASRDNGEGREAWQVDPLTRKVFVHSLTAWLDQGEAERLRDAFEAERKPFDASGQSPDGEAIYAVLAARDAGEAESALRRLPADMQKRLEALSPVNYFKDVHPRLIVVLHDRGDQLIPVGESRRLVAAFRGQAGVHFNEMQFSHLDPSKGKLSPLRLAREFGKFFGAVYPLFREAFSDWEGS